MDNEFHQFSFERPNSKIEMHHTNYEKRSFYSQYDTDSKPLHISPSSNTAKKPHHMHFQKNKADNSPTNNYSPDTRSLLLPNEIYLNLKENAENKRKLTRKLLIFAIFSFLLTIAEMAMGFISNSLCLMIDSLRFFYLFKAFSQPYLSINLHEIAPNKTYTFGYQRFEVICSLVLIFFQWGLIIGLIVEASKRWFVDFFELSKEIMLITAIIGLLFNLTLRKTLSYLKGQESFQEMRHFQGNFHEQPNNSCILNKRPEENDNTDTIISDRRKDLQIQGISPNSLKKFKKTLELDTEYLEEQKNYSELVEDPFPAKESIILPSFSYSKASSFRSENSYADSKDNIKEIIKDSLVDIFQHTSVLIATLIIYFDPQLKFFDIIFTYILGLFIMLASLRSIKENVLILMEAAPSELDVNIIGYNLRQIPEVTDLHNLHIWKIGPGKNAFSVHLKAQKSADLLAKVNSLLNRMGIFYISLQIEEDFSYENQIIC